MAGMRGVVLGNKLLMCVADRGGKQNEMGIYEASHPITYCNILMYKSSPQGPPMTYCPVHSSQLRLHVGMGEKPLLLIASNLHQYY